MVIIIGLGIYELILQICSFANYLLPLHFKLVKTNSYEHVEHYRRGL